MSKCIHGISLRKPCGQCVRENNIGSHAESFSPVQHVAVPPSVGEFAIGERDQLLARIAELEQHIEQQDDAFAQLSLDAGQKMDELERELSALKQPSAGVDELDVIWREIQDTAMRHAEPPHIRFAEALQARAQLAAPAGVPDELCRAFITAESGDGNYRVVIKSETLQETQQVHNWLCRLNANEPASEVVPVPRDVAKALLDEGNRAETWRAQDKLRALLNGGRV